MKILDYNYPATCPLDSSAKVMLCEEETDVYNEVVKREYTIQKLFLMTESGIIFSNQEIERKNRERLEKARKRRYTKK